MAGVLDTVNQRTQMVGQNRLELLLFSLDGKQKFGINVFKVKEVIRCMSLTVIPKSSPMVRGLVHIRGFTLPVIDLSLALGGKAAANPKNCFIIITEYNQSVQGFLVSAVEKIVNMKWEAIHSPPPGITNEFSYLTAVTEVDNQLVEIIDVEKILQEITPLAIEVGDKSEERKQIDKLKTKTVLIVDDSTVARNQIKKTLEQLGLDVVTYNDGKQGLEYLKQLAETGGKVEDKLFMVISDIEMPEMDGYTLTAEVRADPRLKNLFIAIHSSLSGGFNNALVEKVGANKLLPKFEPGALVAMVMTRVKELNDSKQ